MRKTKKYGIYIGRFQPFHIGHEHTYNKIKEDGLIPIILVGSANESDTAKNPLTYFKRVEIILRVFPDAIVLPISDSYSNTTWLNDILDTIEGLITKDLDEVVLYTHDKPEDKYDFVFNEKEYKNENYSKMFSESNVAVKKVELSDIPISGTAIRAKLSTNKEFLRESTIEILEKEGW